MQKVLSFQEDGQKHNIVIKIEFVPLADYNILPFLERVLKNEVKILNRLFEKILKSTFEW